MAQTLNDAALSTVKARIRVYTYGYDTPSRQSRSPSHDVLALFGDQRYTFGEVAGGKLSAWLDYTYRSKLFFNVVPRVVPFDGAIRGPGVGLLNGRIALSNVSLGGANAEFAVWGRNPTDKKYRMSGIDLGALGFATNTYGVPRTYGAEMRMEF